MPNFKTSRAVAFLIYFWIACSLRFTSANADEPILESFSVKNVQMWIVCNALRLANCSIDTEYVETDDIPEDGQLWPRAHYKDATGTAVFWVSREPLLSFSLQNCTPEQILKEACRLSGYYKLSRRKNGWRVLQRDSELPNTIINRDAFAGTFRDYFITSPQLKNYFRY